MLINCNATLKKIFTIEQLYDARILGACEQDVLSYPIYIDALQTLEILKLIVILLH